MGQVVLYHLNEWLMVEQTDDVLRLLNTNDGDYAATCSLDFSKPPQFYDTFALRDSEGHEMLMQTWPYFQARESRRAILSNDAVPVSSCWNGMGKLVPTTGAQFSVRLLLLD